MFLKLLNLFRSYYRRWVYGLMAVMVALTITLTHASPSYGISWLDLVIQGIQVVQLSNISNAQEVALGKEINQQIIRSGQAKIYNNQPINDYINQIGQRLAQTSKRANIPYTFQVVDDDGINAFATMGGYVYVNKGLIATADNEAELASVIGHEIGHIAARHAVKQMRERAISQGLMSAAGLNRSDAVKIGVELAINRPNSRSDELEADRFGLENLKGAGYAPAGMLGFMQKLLKAGGSTPGFLSTHPATSDRIKVLQQLVDPATANVGEGLDNQAYRSRIGYL
ncbi:peptidase M48 Ste24p [Chondrocystis sp. NIES-4102]|nr:peptidase M48 Ste24p [Chondrocystis sp. NIES-4102]